jgi:transposase
LCAGAAIIPVPSGVKVWLATGHTDMQEELKRDPMCGHLFVFRGRGGGLIKVIWHDGQGACLFTKKLERGRFIWPSAADGTVVITPAQLGYLLEGIDWRMPQKTCGQRRPDKQKHWNDGVEYDSILS